jgi:hypothetical protein
VKSDNVRMKAMLPVSAVVNNFCAKADSCDVMAVREIIQALDDVIGYRCSINDGNIKTVSVVDFLFL